MIKKLVAIIKVKIIIVSVDNNVPNPKAIFIFEFPSAAILKCFKNIN